MCSSMAALPVVKVKKVKKASKPAADEKPKKPKKVKGDKKRKADVVAATPESSNEQPAKKVKSKTVSSPAAEVTAAGSPLAAAAVAVADPHHLSNQPLSEPIKALLRAKGIEALFPIQADTLQPLLSGIDLVGRARTGQGKTLAFVLPIIEKLMPAGGAARRPFGRLVKVIVLAPTRELAKQVHAEFEYIGKAAGVSTLCVYGGSPYGPQESAMRRGVDVVVGTPGRVKDHVEKGTLKLNDLMFRVLDECDEMLNMGFVDDVEYILKAGGDLNQAKIQTLLFSATLPAWVKSITQRFLKNTFKTVDLVGNDTMKASRSVKHLMLPCHWSQRGQVVGDLVRCYGACGRTIVFTDTKKDANEVAASLASTVGAQALHGDIPQSQREVTLAGFRKGKFPVLVATDVAARGLDIDGVELVLQTEPPKEPETYIHRSGRTGRAGTTGTCITLVDRRKEGLIPYIEKKAGVKFSRIGAPQPQDMARMAGERAVEAVLAVSSSVVPWFQDAAQQLLDGVDDPVQAVAMALAKITGHTELRARSLLTAHEDYTTLQLHTSTQIQRPGYVFGVLRQHIAEDVVETLTRMTMTLDGKGAIFDVPTQHVKQFLEKCGKDAAASSNGKVVDYVTVPAALPPLRVREGGSDAQQPGRSPGGGYGGARSFGRGGRGGGRGGGAGFGRGGRGGRW